MSNWRDEPDAWDEDLDIKPEDFEFARKHGGVEIYHKSGESSGIFIEPYKILLEYQKEERKFHEDRLIQKAEDSGGEIEDFMFGPEYEEEREYLDIEFRDSEFWVTSDAGDMPFPIFEEEYL